MKKMTAISLSMLLLMGSVPASFAAHIPPSETREQEINDGLENANTFDYKNGRILHGTISCNADQDNFNFVAKYSGKHRIYLALPESSGSIGFYLYDVTTGKYAVEYAEQKERFPNHYPILEAGHVYSLCIYGTDVNPNPYTIYLDQVRE